MTEKPKVNPNAKWDESRCAELEQLQTLLFAARSINRSTNALEHIANCIAIAETLTAFDGDRPNFKEFLRALAIEDRFGKQP